MYLTERIVGIVTYMGIMLLFTYLIYKSSSKEKLKRYLIIYWAILAIMAFVYIPSKTADLSRLFDELHRYSKIDFSKLLEIIPESSTPSRNIYFWTIGKLGVDGLLPAITSMIFFGNVFAITYKSAKKFNIENKNVAISLLFFMEFGKFLEVISGIRSLMAFSVIALCVYTEVAENRKIFKNILLYIFAAFMHPAAMILTIIRLILILLQSEKNKIKKLVNIFLVFVLGFILYKYASGNIEFATEKAESYMGNHVYSYIWEYIISWIYVIFSTVTLLVFGKILKQNIEVKNLRKINLIMNIIIIALSYEYSIFSRFSVFSGILFIPILSYVLQDILNSKLNSKAYLYLFILVSISIFFLVSTRGNLSGYKYLLFS